jgi:alditol oxidase
LIQVVEAALAPFQPMPHWGKLTRLPMDTFRRRLPRLDEAARVRAELDPNFVFGNTFREQTYPATS